MMRFFEIQGRENSEQWLKDFREVSMLIWKDVLKKK